MLKRARTVLFWCHLACGVTAGAVILMMCVTGVALAYQRQIQWWADTRHFHAEPPAGGQRVPMTTLLAAVRAVDSGPASTVTFRADPAAPAAVTVGVRTVFVNPYTAQIYGDGTGAQVRQFFATMVSWHRYVAQSGDRRPAGKSVTDAANLVFLFLLLSGLYLWWPKSLRWPQIRQVVWFRRGLRGKARDFNWHNTLGFWSVIPLALVVYSGVVISYPWATNLVYRSFGEQPPAPAAGRAGAAERPRDAAASASQIGAIDLDRVVSAATAFQPEWNILAVRVPASADRQVTVALDRGDGGQPHLRGTLTMDSDGRVERWEGASSLTRGRRARNFLRFAHTGEVAGLAGQTIAGIASAAGAVLVYTGIALALRRMTVWRTRAR